MEGVRHCFSISAETQMADKSLARPGLYWIYGNKDNDDKNPVRTS
jgi:hypothetical protein